MADIPRHDTATIVEFPGRRRGRRAADAGSAVVVLTPRRLPAAGFASVGFDAWYHEAAVREADRDAGH
ncbi:MAG TPA: DUF2735 domain-containing protein [Rhizobiales bacterium]|nr:DUF2735 domain-containing protein [Hyphomicrobiales bacterium]